MKTNFEKRFLLVVMLVLVLPLMAFSPLPTGAMQEVEPAAEPGAILVTVLGYLAVILLLSYVVETIVEGLLGRVIANVPALGKFSWMQVYVAVIFGIIGAWVYRLDLIALLAMQVKVDITTTWFGITITGFAIGMGAAYIHQIIAKFFPEKQG